MSGRRVIGVDLGGTKILAGILDETGVLGELHERPTPTSSQEALLDALVETVADLSEPGIEAVGFGIPARINQRTGAALGAVNTPIHDVRMRDELEGRLGMRVGVINDGSAAALAEFVHGAGRRTRDLVLLTLGTGVGGGLVLDGQLYRGWSEVGHMVIVEDGEPCQGVCTGRGHVESYCSGRAADRLAREVLGPAATAHDLVEQRHPSLRGIGRHLGAAIASLINLFDPDVVVVGGGFGVAAFDQLVGPAREAARREALRGGGEVPIVRAQLGLEAGLVGAALAARDALD